MTFTFKLEQTTGRRPTHSRSRSSSASGTPATRSRSAPAAASASSTSATRGGQAHGAGRRGRTGRMKSWRGDLVIVFPHKEVALPQVRGLRADVAFGTARREKVGACARWTKRQRFRIRFRGEEAPLPSRMASMGEEGRPRRTGIQRMPRLWKGTRTGTHHAARDAPIVRAHVALSVGW